MSTEKVAYDSDPAPEPTAEERLAAVKAARRKIAEASKAAEDAAALELAIAHEERALKDETAIEAAKRKHGAKNIVVIRDVGAKTFDVVILKRAHAAAFKAFQDKEGFKLSDVEELVTPCVEYPAKDAFETHHTHEAPMVLSRCAEGVAYLAGMRKSSDLGKV
jgi:hypothetical protein